MKALEAVVFISLAGALHAAAFGLSDLPGGGQTGGDAGQDSVTLTAVAPSVQALVDRWDTPPAPVAVPQPAVAPALETALPRLLHTRPSALQRPAMAAPPAQPAPIAETAPQADTQLPAQNLDLGQPPDLPTAPTKMAALPALAAQNATVPRRPVAPNLSQQAPDHAPDHVETSAPSPPELTPETAPRQSLRPIARPDRPAPKQVATQPGRAAQKAKGQANRESNASPQAAAQAPGPSAKAIANAQAQWGGQIRQRIARAQRYPAGTSATGVVKLRITVARTGRLAKATVVASSGNARLDRAALQAVQRARLPAAPDALRNASYSFNLPLRFAR